MTDVLVVDDEPSLVRALQINLKARHYQVRTAVTGSDALQVAASHPPDLIILDLGCPTWTACRSSRDCEDGPPSRSWCCPAAPTAPTRSKHSTPAPTTT